MTLSPWLCVCSELVAQGRDKGREREREIEGKRETRTRMESLTKYPRPSYLPVVEWIVIIKWRYFRERERERRWELVIRIFLVESHLVFASFFKYLVCLPLSFSPFIYLSISSFSLINDERFLRCFKTLVNRSAETFQLYLHENLKYTASRKCLELVNTLYLYVMCIAHFRYILHNTLDTNMDT